jgi:hypothetical protein
MGRAISLLTITDTQSLRRLEWTYGIRLKMLETPSREETLKMLAERRVRELKEMIEAGRVIPEEFLAIAREILEDPDAPRLVASLVDAWLTPASEEPRRQEPPEPPRRDPSPKPRHRR